MRRDRRLDADADLIAELIGGGVASRMSAARPGDAIHQIGTVARRVKGRSHRSDTRAFLRVHAAVMDHESGESMEPMEEVPLKELGESEMERLVRGSKGREFRLCRVAGNTV